MGDTFRWKLSQGKLLNEGPILTKQYDLEDQACVFWNDFIGPCIWLYSLSGESEQAPESEGRMLRVMQFAGGGENLTNDGAGEITRLIPLTGTSVSGSDSEGVLSPLWDLQGESITDITGDGLFLRIIAVEGTSENITYWRNDYYWLLPQGKLLDEGPPLTKQYDTKDPIHAFWDDFIGPHRNYIMRLKGVDGESITKAKSDGILTLLWDLLGASKTGAKSTGILSLNWSLSGDSLTLTDGTGILSMLWRLTGNSINITDGKGRPLRIRQISGKSITLVIGEGTVIKWPLTLVINKQKIFTVRLGVERLTYIGNTLRLTAEFRNSDDELEDPGDVSLKIYDNRREVINEFKVQPYSRGKYRHDYTIPEIPLGSLFFEYAGKLGNRTILARANIERIWAES